MTDFTVILPHKRNPGNDRSLAIALDCLMANTTNDFKLLIDAARNEPLYDRLHRLVVQSETECVVYMTSDTYVAPDWDTPMLEAWTSETLVFGIVMEPGMMGHYPGNLFGDFGRRPEQFRRAEFEAWAQADDALPEGYGFPAPMCIPRDLYLKHDGFLLGQEDFSKADSAIIERMVAAGAKQARVKSYFYHLSRYSDIAEQTDAKRN